MYEGRVWSPPELGQEARARGRKYAVHGGVQHAKGMTTLLLAELVDEYRKLAWR